MNNICVFCGSSSGKNIQYRKTAEELGELMALGGHSLVYGGGRLGLMGIVADAALTNNGKVIGVIPDFMMDKEVAHTGLTSLHVTESMHERKFVMAQMSDAFIVLPGGMGTLDELAEILSWNQLGLINKPILLLNVNNYYDSLIKLFDEMLSNGFLGKDARELVLVSNTPIEALGTLTSYKPHTVNVWGKIRRG